VQGTGGLKTYLKINLAAAPGGAGSCGVKYDPRTEERRVAIGGACAVDSVQHTWTVFLIHPCTGVRAHNTIELLEDRLYVVTCAKAGFQNSRNQVDGLHVNI
jgi:hypothetical protein